MFKQLKLQLAARRIMKGDNEMTHTEENSSLKKPTFWSKIRKIAAWPFKACGRLCQKAWQRIRHIDLIGLINLTLLIAIIVLFSILILNICQCNKKTVLLVAPDTVSTIGSSSQAAFILTENTVPAIQAKRVTLPLKKDTKYDIIKRVKTNEKDNRLYGDIIVDGDFPGERLSNGVKIQGNLYLQNMHRYVLPCNTHIDGNLFLRDVGMLKFCGDFVITGNIYVSRRSSFGPIPRTARLGGQVIL